MGVDGERKGWDRIRVVGSSRVGDHSRVIWNRLPPTEVETDTNWWSPPVPSRDKPTFFVTTPHSVTIISL